MGDKIVYFNDFLGVVNNDLDFKKNNDVLRWHPRMGCAVTLRGQMWYLGGFHSGTNEYARQVEFQSYFTKRSYLF